MRARRRRQFRGPVSVEMAMFGGSAQAPATVKAYLDCLEDVVYPDDRAVEHLVVSRWGFAQPETEEKVYIHIEPLSSYTACFDYAFSEFRRLDEAHDCFWEDEAPHRARPFRQHDEAELSQLELQLEWDEEEDDGELEELGFEDMAATLRMHRREELAALHIKRIVDQPIHYLDRPGKPPRWLGPLLKQDPTVDIANPIDDWELPGTFWLPTPGPGWPEQIRTEMLKRRAHWKLWNTPLRRNVGLDIAVQGLSPAGKDLDNLAHAILVPFEEVFGDGSRGQVQTYRVDQRVGARSGIRVRLIEPERIEASHRIIDDAHYSRLEPVLD